MLETVVSTLASGLIAAVIVGWLSQKWIERRERRGRRDELRLELYLDIIEIVMEYESLLARSTGEGQTQPEELQTKRFRASHKLKLLGSPEVQQAYDEYGDLVYKETALPRDCRPKSPDKVRQARDELIDTMAEDVSGCDRRQKT